MGTATPTRPPEGAPPAHPSINPGYAEHGAPRRGDADVRTGQTLRQWQDQFQSRPSANANSGDYVYINRAVHGISMETRAHAAAARRLTKLDLADRDSDTGRKAAAPPMGPRLVSIYIISPTYTELHSWSATSAHGLQYKRPTAAATIL